jgi:integrase
MPRIVEHARIETATSRVKLKRGKRHYQSLITGKAHIGYRREDDAPHGRWFIRRNLGGEKYQYVPLGIADDQKGVEADGVMVLSFEQAKASATDLLSKGFEKMPKGTLTVRKACAKYIEYLTAQGKQTLETERRFAALVLPELGNLRVDELTSERLRKWHFGMVPRPALLRSKRDGSKNTKPTPEDEESLRKRKVTANRILSMLKAAFNYCYDEKWTDSNDAWGRRLKPFKGVDQARTRYLSVAEAKRLINACEPDFRLMVQAALQTGCRYAELCRLAVSDFNPDAGTVAIRKSKSGKPRNVILSPEGTAFFTAITIGRRGKEVLLRNEGRIARALEAERERLKRDGKDPAKATVEDTGEWRAAEQARPMREACVRAQLEHIPIHGLRHTWASLSVMAGMPLQVVARNLGHADTRMVEKHYGHLAPDFVKQTIHASAPRFGFEPDEKIKTFKAA